MLGLNRKNKRLPEAIAWHKRDTMLGVLRVATTHFSVNNGFPSLCCHSFYCHCHIKTALSWISLRFRLINNKSTKYLLCFFSGVSLSNRNSKLQLYSIFWNCYLFGTRLLHKHMEKICFGSFQLSTCDNICVTVPTIALDEFEGTRKNLLGVTLARDLIPHLWEMLSTDFLISYRVTSSAINFPYINHWVSYQADKSCPVFPATYPLTSDIHCNSKISSQLDWET